MRNTWLICRRELAGYFNTPLAYVFIIIFLVMSGITTFFLGNFFARNQADLQPFFTFHPWLYLFFIPTLAMRLWAEERKSGTIELLLTLPVTLPQAVIGKFIAAWIVTGLALLLTFSLWFSVNYLGTPDNGVIMASYAGSFLMAGGFLAIGCFVSALTRNQVIAFVLGCSLCFAFMASGSAIILDLFSGWAPQYLLDSVSGFSFITRFESITRGVIDIRDIIYFLSVMVFFLYANILVVDWKKAG